MSAENIMASDFQTAPKAAWKNERFNVTRFLFMRSHPTIVATGSALLRRISNWKVIQILSAVCLLSAVGCASTNSRPTTKTEAIRQANVDAWCRLCPQTIQLPAVKTGSGTHDFYNLFARTTTNEPAIYGISIALAKRMDAETVTIVANGSPIKLVATGKALLGLVNAFNGTFSRDFLESAASTGAVLEVTDQHKSVSFNVPGWMFAALMETADERDLQRHFELASQAAERSLQEKQRKREEFVNSQEALTPRIRDAILSGSITIGMTSDAAMVSWGKPSKINRTVTEFGVREQWIYGDHLDSTYVFFDNGILKSWHDSR